MTDLTIYTSDQLLAGKVDSAVWYHPPTETTHTIEVRLQRAEPKPPLFRVTHVVVHADGKVTDRAYLYDSAPKAYTSAGNVRRSNPLHRGRD
jgi:hypothetical protein